VKTSIASTLVACSLAFCGCSTTHHRTWEYKTVVDVSDEQLNQLADQGWRVEDFSVASQSNGALNKAYVLKRPKQP